MIDFKANFQIDRQGKVPLYHQIDQNIRALMGIEYYKQVLPYLPNGI